MVQKKNRQYTERWKILMKYKFSPKTDIIYNNDGILTTTENFSNEFKEDIFNYFLERKEDDV